MKKRKQQERLSDIPMAPCTIGGRPTGPVYTTLGKKFDMTEEQLRSLDRHVPLRDSRNLFVGEGQQPLSASIQETDQFIDTMAQDVGYIAAGETLNW